MDTYESYPTIDVEAMACYHATRKLLPDVPEGLFERYLGTAYESHVKCFWYEAQEAAAKVWPDNTPEVSSMGRGGKHLVINRLPSQVNKEDWCTFTDLIGEIYDKYNSPHTYKATIKEIIEDERITAEIDLPGHKLVQYAREPGYITIIGTTDGESVQLDTHAVLILLPYLNLFTRTGSLTKPYA